MNDHNIIIRFAMGIDPGDCPPELIERLLKVRRELLPTANRDITVDRHIMADLATRLEDLAQLMRRASACQPPEDSGRSES